MLHQTLNQILLKACEKGKIKEVEQSLKEGADIQVKDDFGDTPLHWAALEGHLDIVTLLLEKNVEVNVQNSKGDTPLNYATPWGYREIIDLLKRHGATQ